MPGTEIAGMALDQWAIAVLGAVAVWLSQSAHEPARRLACLAGLIEGLLQVHAIAHGQPAAHHPETQREEGHVAEPADLPYGRRHGSSRSDTCLRRARQRGDVGVNTLMINRRFDP